MGTSLKGPYLEYVGNLLRLQSPDVLASTSFSTKESDGKGAAYKNLVVVSSLETKKTLLELSWTYERNDHQPVIGHHAEAL